MEKREDSTATIGQDTFKTKRPFWMEIRNAIRGTDADYTQIGIRKAIFLLAVPMILELIMELTFAVVDIYFVGKLGASAVATVGLSGHRNIKPGLVGASLIVFCI